MFSPRHFFKETLHVDWMLFVPALLLSLAGLVTMGSFTGDHYFFSRQIIWLGVSLVVFFVATAMDWRFLRDTKFLVFVYALMIVVLGLLFVLGRVSHGAQSWFDLGAFAFQPSDLAKLATILILAKYFSRRHIEIANVRHILVSGLYAFIIFFLVFLQPDFGGGVTILGIWAGMVLVSGISKKHLLGVLTMGAIAGVILWSLVFAPYQKARIISFINPMADIQGAGYNAYQSTIAVGSGEIMGKGVGYGTQSKLLFLPEYQTDFIFAAFAEEWGLIGSALIIIIFLVLLFRIIENARVSATNFEAFFALGLATLFTIQLVIHVGMNMGFLPVTGIVLPFMSYGGSHLITEWLALGILCGMKRFSAGPRTKF